MSDDAAVTQQIVADHGRRVARHVERVVTLAAEDLRDERLFGALHEEPIVTFGAVHAQRLDIDKTDRQSGAKDAVLGDHKIVAKLGADHDQGVRAVATVDIHGGVDRVLHQVGAGAAGDVGALPLRLLRSNQCERTNFESIVARVAVKRQLGLVVEYNEDVVVQPAVDCHRRADAVRQKAASGLDRRELVVHRHVRSFVRPLRAEQLADLESILTQLAVDRDRRRSIVNGELVISQSTVDHNLLDAGVVDPLDVLRVVGGVCVVQFGDQRHKGQGAIGVGAEQELVVEHGAADDKQIVANKVSAVLDGDQGRSIAALERQQVGVAAVLTVQ